MKRINRAKLRGEPLDEDCKKLAFTTTGEYGQDDKRCFCYGLVDLMRDEPLKKCCECKAFIDNATPPNL